MEPEDFAITLSDLAERPDVMYDQHTFEKADWLIRSWGKHFAIEVEALQKLEMRKLVKQHSQNSVVTSRKGMLWVCQQNDSPNWPLDDRYDALGVSLDDLKEQWTPVLDDHIEYDAIQYLYERFPELYRQLEDSKSQVDLSMESMDDGLYGGHPLPNTSEWMMARMVMELHVRQARRAMRDLEAMVQHVQKAVDVMAELDWEHRNTERFLFGPMAETKRLAIIMT